MSAVDRIGAFHDEMTAWRRDIHAHPELGFEEHRTSDLVARRLEAFGLEVYRGIGRTGVVGALRSGNSPRSVGLRADMDALPIQEATGLEYRSRNDGRMHACGHDGHTAMLLGAARYLAETRDFEGQVFFIFQPAEEGLGGAKAMIEDGLFEQFPCDAIFGIHNRPKLPVGKFAVRSGAMMAGGAFFDIDIEGVGAHGARPEASVDPVVVASHMVTAIQSVVSRNVRPTETAVVSVTRLHAGDAYNVIPQSARLGGTVRAFSVAVVELVERSLERIASGVAESYGARARLDFRPSSIRPQSPRGSRVRGLGLRRAGRNENVERNLPPIMAPENFSFMLERVPGCYVNLGNGDAEGACEVHNPGYDFNAEALPLGPSFFARVVETRLARESA